MNGPRASGDAESKAGDPWLKAIGCPAPQILAEGLRTVLGRELGHVFPLPLSLSEAARTI
jgi:hypothetical protein